jgi:hypothetical protein
VVDGIHILTRNRIMKLLPIALNGTGEAREGEQVETNLPGYNIPIWNSYLENSYLEFSL